MRRARHLIAFKITPLEPQAGAEAPLPPRRHLGLLLLHPLPCEVPAFEATMSVMGPCKVRFALLMPALQTTIVPSLMRHYPCPYTMLP